jgi:hypothetical protein
LIKEEEDRVGWGGEGRGREVDGGGERRREGREEGEGGLPAAAQPK